MKSVREFGQELPYGGLKYQACVYVSVRVESWCKEGKRQASTRI